MPTRLRKIVNQSFVPAVPGDAGFAGQPALGERWVWVTRNVCSYVTYTPAQLAAMYAGLGVRYEFIEGTWQLYIPPGVSIPTNHYECRNVTEQVYYPAQPYVPPRTPRPASPAQTVQDFQLGWNARAHSLDALERDGFFSFTIPHTVVGVICGLAATPQATGFADISHAFRVSGSALTIVEYGVHVMSVATLTAPADLAIRRAAGVIAYLVDGSVVHTSTTPPPGGAVVLSAAMYAGGDLVDDAELTALVASGSGDADLFPMRALGADEDGYAVGDAWLHPMRAVGSSTNVGTGDADLHPMRAIGADAGGYAVGEATFHGLEGEGEGIEELTISLGTAMFLPMQAIGTGVAGTTGGGAAFFSPMRAIGADENGYAQGQAYLHPMRADGENFTPANEAVIYSNVIAIDASEQQGLFAVLMNSEGAVTGVIAAQPMRTAMLLSSAEAGATLLTSAELEAILRSSTTAVFDWDGPGSGAKTWALHLGVGSTRYENFSFNSFAKVGTKQYGANADGLYVLEGPDDDGEEVEASIDFGNLNFGATVRKNLRYCYLGVASNGRLILKVEADDETYYYDMRNDAEYEAMQRFELGRGLRAVYYRVTLLNTGGSLFDLDSIEFIPLPLTRRL